MGGEGEVVDGEAILGGEEDGEVGELVEVALDGERDDEDDYFLRFLMTLH